MGRATSKTSVLFVCAFATLLGGVTPGAALADADNPGHIRPDFIKPEPSFAAHVTTDNNGVNVEISGKETVGVAPVGQQTAAAPAQPAAPAPAPAVAAAPPPQIRPGTWSNGSDYHRVTPSGQTVDYVQPSITSSNAPYWNDQAANHAGEA